MYKRQGVSGVSTTREGGRFEINNNANTSHALNVSTNGSGRGVFATSAIGTGVEGTTNALSAGGIIGRNFAGGEAIIGFVGANSNSGAGAVVGRNDGAGYGVRGFNTQNGIGVFGQAGISGGTGVAGRFENVNSGNSTNTCLLYTSRCV